MLLGMMLFGLPSYFLASRKGFENARWILTFGLIGLIVLLCLPSAHQRGISYDEVRSRAHKANKIGAILCATNVVVLFVFLAIRTISQATAS